jgi:hypothetical protein
MAIAAIRVKRIDVWGFMNEILLFLISRAEREGFDRLDCI